MARSSNIEGSSRSEGSYRVDSFSSLLRLLKAMEVTLKRVKILDGAIKIEPLQK